MNRLTESPDDLSGTLELRTESTAPPGDVVPALARLLRKLRDGARRRTLPLPQRSPTNDRAADQAAAEKAG